jgi:hypothetical protein
MKLADILTQMKSINLPKGSYIVFGSGPMAALGIRDVGDIDLLVSEELYAELQKAGWKQITKGPDDKPLVSGDFEAHNNWNFVSYQPTLDELLSRAFMIDGIPFVSIEDVRLWKDASRRPKDLTDIALIDTYLAQQHT